MSLILIFYTRGQQSQKLCLCREIKLPLGIAKYLMSSMHLEWEDKAGKKWFARRYANEEQATKEMARILGEVRPVFRDAIADGTLFQRSKEEDEFVAYFRADKRVSMMAWRSTS